MKLSLCITTFNRPELTIQSFENVLYDDRIDDIVIMDDASDIKALDYLRAYVRVDETRKVRLIERNRNVGMSQNKRDAIARAKNEWCIIFDSDNIINTSYIDAFYNFCIDGEALELFNQIADIEKFIFSPDSALPNFIYTEFKCGNNGIGIRTGIYGAKECAHEIDNDNFNCLMNTCNYIVNRDFYLKTYVHNKEHKASDTIWHNYNHLKAGGKIVIVPGMQYFHRVHAGSGFMKDAQYNIAKANEVRQLIKQLK